MARIRIKDLKQPRGLARAQLKQIRGGGRKTRFKQRKFYDAW